MPPDVGLGKGNRYPMVGLEHDKGILGKPGFFQLNQHSAYHVVGPAYGTVVLGYLLPDGGQIGQKTGDYDFVGLIDSGGRRIIGPLSLLFAF